MPDEKQPAGDMVTTFTLRAQLYGVDQEGKIWRRTGGGPGWEAAGALEEKKP